jgi:hypothetical protein
MYIQAPVLTSLCPWRVAVEYFLLVVKYIQCLCQSIATVPHLRAIIWASGIMVSGHAACMQDISSVYAKILVAVYIHCRIHAGIVTKNQCTFCNSEKHYVVVFSTVV